MFSKIITLAAATVCFALAVACSGGGEADDTAREITNDQLAQMVLAAADFGPEYSAFSPDPDNTGVLTLDTASEDDFDPAAERADLEAFQFLTGHEAFYSGEPDAGGTFYLGTSVGTFQGAVGASDYLEDSIAEVPEDVGKSSQGVTLKQMELFESKVADQAAGASGVSSVARDDGSSIDYWFTTVAFRRGRLMGTVAMYAVNPSDLEKQRLEGKVKALASVMNERIASVLAATVPTAAPAAAGQ